jgi:threonyl-tRNA synthetase
MINLSTRPKMNFLGSVESWNQAENILEESLNQFGLPFEINEGDGAFYGPKIDIVIKDSLERSHQCATIQLDFQLPERFDLKYISKAGKLERPIIIHRALLGSVERMLAILCEHYQGRWPFWLSPRQLTLIPVHSGNINYTMDLRKFFNTHGYHVDVDLTDNTLSKKIRKAELLKTNFISVIGNEEVATRNISLRDSVSKKSETISVEEVIKKFEWLQEKKH